ncbi:MAG: hypothetical protein A2X34_07855 [Elusimicrobia bacterium GWC2_51_8]|nr:MAG: hypothetical protein A2X33_00010 [Elusimicrobia bacterium GWA2_51_34]OGR62709.1 MAG: hypothetical protein A2X34_07855 [Elusimicrobia bacterium GWC2_51_8]OGR87459.1 MAG: hypothetical protein A2021_08930 [Elusimicrobia bacterium GWF2_52_66]HAF94461.1 hypothetical protein [Elusimicrobiota bacterium]HCE98908.1 hypothetical protein [Elusimicrobiota bacterium]
MKGKDKDEKLILLLAARKPDEFWARQKAEIMAAAGEKRGLTRSPWLLAPAAAVAAAMLVLVLARVPRHAPADAPQAVSTAFLENLDLLDDMDVLEAVTEEEL